MLRALSVYRRYRELDVGLTHEYRNRNPLFLLIERRGVRASADRDLATVEV
jgi:hypothetical protein